MRRIDPDAPRPFRCPLVRLIPLLGIAFCLLLMFSLLVERGAVSRASFSFGKRHVQLSQACPMRALVGSTPPRLAQGVARPFLIEVCLLRMEKRDQRYGLILDQEFPYYVPRSLNYVSTVERFRA
jgi:hypothetical protein